MQNKFKIITPSFNNKDFVEYNLASVLNQTYKNFDLLYIDDNSTDGTADIVYDILKDYPNCKLIRNETNKGALSNYMDNLEGFIENENDIIIHLDGDDWLYDENVLDKLNDFYNKHDCWMTYGQFVCYNGTENPTTPHPQGTEYPEFVKNNSLYRRDLWRPSHMRTYRSFLFKKIDRKDLVSKIDGKDYWHASDLGMQYPCLEMCGPEKFKALDFVSYVYNVTPKNVDRTKEREHKSNEMFEVEIRNKKKYKQGLSGEKLPQINVFGDYKERNSIPKTFSYVYNIIDGEFDVTVLQDGDILKYLNGDIKINHGKVVADIHEPRHIFNQHIVYDVVEQNASKFDRILTFDSKLLKLENARFRNGGYECVLNKNVHTQQYPILQDSTLYKIYENKQKLVSCISSNKTFSDGHKKRFEMVNHIKRLNKVDFFGVGIKEIVGKIDALKDYKFSIAIENGIHENYFTEKILDCFLTGTIPIYCGCSNIKTWFDPRGIITFNTKEELFDIINNLTIDDYDKRKQYIEFNFKRAMLYQYDNDILFNNFIKDLIDG